MPAIIPFVDTQERHKELVCILAVIHSETPIAGGVADYSLNNKS